MLVGRKRRCLEWPLYDWVSANRHDRFWPRPSPTLPDCPKADKAARFPRPGELSTPRGNLFAVLS